MITAEQARALGSRCVDCETSRYLNNIYTYIEANAWHKDSASFLISYPFEEVDYSKVVANVVQELEGKGFDVSIDNNGTECRYSEIHISWSKED